MPALGVRERHDGCGSACASKESLLRHISLAWSLVAALMVLAGCTGGDKSAAVSSAVASTVAPAAAGAAARPAEPAKSTPVSVAQEGASIGVPACDEYVKKYLECVSSRVPAVSRGQYRTAFDQAIKAWRQAASTPEGQAGLAMGCKQAQVSSAQAMKAYGCSF
jgi:hypothetical protein